MLVVGMGGLAAELCKNLVLAGVGGLTMMDETTATEEDLTAQFLIDAADVGHKTVRGCEPKSGALVGRVEGRGVGRARGGAGHR